MVAIVQAVGYSTTAQDTTSTLGLAASSVTEILQYGAVPSSLDASIITSYIETKPHSQSVISYQIDCATSNSLENDACRALSIYPAIAYRMFISK
jgi:hypothetical protein